MRSFTRIGVAGLLVVAAGCGLIAQRKIDDRYGAPNAARYDAASTSPAARAAWEKASTVLEVPLGAA